MTAHLNHSEWTKKISLARLGTPQEVAQGVEYLVNANYVTGSTLVIDGGLH